MAEQDLAQHRLVCEARYWLRRGYNTPNKFSELCELLNRRSAVSLEQLIEEMRRQWKRRSAW
ncbi:hypothetical protein HKW98_09155 [Stutzerimonas urumqiensis]|uniref:DUF7696 family protein n=1 Tax=Stutzerimonas urumqiensis TaxID=638269 RepID=UPI003BACB5EC